MGIIHQEVFPMSWDQIQAQYKLCNTDPKKVKECVKILEEWYQKQPHLPEKLQFDEFFEKALALCCFRMELCKKKLERRFSCKSHYSDFYKAFDPNVQVLLPSQAPVTFVPMPQLGPHLDRIWVGFIERKNQNSINSLMESTVQLMTACRELIFRYEKANSITVVADCSDYGNNFYYKKDFLKMILRYSMFIYQADNVRVKAVHLVNLSPSWHVFINLLRTFVSQKLMNRLHVHNSYDSLYKAVPKEYLPKEFGGNHISTSQILEKYDTLFLEHQKYFFECDKYVSDESKRIGECPHNAMFGTEGSFRKLEID